MSLIFGVTTMRRLPITGNLLLGEAAPGLLSPNYADLTAMYTMDNVSGTTLVDESASAADGTISGAVSAFGLFGQALDFDGVNDYVSMPTGEVITGANERTVSLWFNRATAVSSGDEVLYMSGNASTDDCFILAVDADEVLLTVWGNSVRDLQTYAGAWHHIVGVYDGTTLRLYYDGAAAGTLVRTITTGSSQHFLGKRTGISYFDGLMDNFRLYDRAISSTEVLQLFGETPELLLGDDNLTIHYTMDRITGTTLTDETANANNGTIGGAIAGAGKFGDALDFDGVNDYVSMPLGEVITGANERTVSLWFNRATAVSSGDEVLYMSGTDTVDDAFIIAITPTEVMITAWVNAVVVTQTYSGAWHHVVAVYDGTTMRLYFDGVEIGTLARTLTTGAAQHYLGARNSTSYFDGLIDQFRLYDRALSPEEIATLFTEEQPIISKGHPDLLGLYTMDNISGATLVDESITETDGTITGATASVGGGIDGNNSLAFAGGTDRVSLTGMADAIETAAEFSFSLWFKRASVPSGYEVLLDSADTSSTSKGGMMLYTLNSGGTIDYAAKNTGGTILVNCIGTVNVCDNAWHHITVTSGLASGFTSRLYIDGVEDATSVASGAWTITPTDVLLGDNHNTSFWTNLTGDLDQVRFFDREITAREVAQLFSEGQ